MAGGFKIVEDYYHERAIKTYGSKYAERNTSNVGRQSKNYEGGTDVQCKVYDDDGNLYYRAVCDNEEGAELFHDWATADSGCTFSKIKEKGKEWGNFIG